MQQYLGLLAKGATVGFILAYALPMIGAPGISKATQSLKGVAMIGAADVAANMAADVVVSYVLGA